MAAQAPPTLLLQGCRVLDTVLGECSETLFNVLVADGLIRAIQACGSAQPAGGEAAAGARVIDCGGRVLMPGEDKDSAGPGMETGGKLETDCSEDTEPPCLPACPWGHLRHCALSLASLTAPLSGPPCTGLLDAHVHCTACTANLPGLMSLPESLVAARAARILEGMLLRGFTTVRDAGGADWGLAQAGVVSGTPAALTSRR